MIHDTADKAIHTINTQVQRSFSQLKMAKWDELNVVRKVSAAYKSAVRLARRCYLEVAKDAFIRALIEAGYSLAAAKRRAEDIIIDEWLEDILTENNELTLYNFDNEVDRKQQRMVEAVTAAHDKGAQIDKAMRALSGQLAQYADIIVAAARFEAFDDARVDSVRWITQADERVCDECGPLHNKVFALAFAPRCPLHFRCRCRLVPAFTTP